MKQLAASIVVIFALGLALGSFVLCVVSEPSGSNSRSCRTAQKLGLELRAHETNFIEQDRASVRERELPFLVRGCARKGAFHAAEKLGLEKGLRNRSAIHFDERHVALSTPVVNGACGELLTRAPSPR